MITEMLRKALSKTRGEHAELLDRLQQHRSELAIAQRQPRARAEILNATLTAIDRLRAGALDEITERAQQLSRADMPMPDAGAFPTDERGRPRMSDALLAACFAEPLRQL